MDEKPPPPTIIVSDWEEGPGAIPKRPFTVQPNRNNSYPFNTRPRTYPAAEVDFVSVDTVSHEGQNETTMADLSSEKCSQSSSPFDLNFSRRPEEEHAQLTVTLQKSRSLPSTTSYGYEMPVTEFTGKIRRKKSRLFCRRKAVAYMKSPLGHDVQGEKRLRQMVQQGNYEEVQSILQDGTNPNRADEKGRAPLHFGVTKGYREIVQLLLDGGSDVNQKDGLGNTPLHLACVGSQVDVVTVLLEAGANCHELDGSGHTPIHLAKSRLNHLRGSSSEASRQEVFKLLGMLRVYMACTGRQEHISKLDNLSQKLQNNHSQKGMDEIQDILDSFTKMNL